ncbi:MAG: tyrosine-protein phosphatase [Anaerolineales bacterium]|nr:tyrosine-protein phosphatase [Anaerolineales bacterium]MCB0017180.1 tyrosine-protein phosphatase [Anaerolineales bacterium]MCB0029894.1 tyrosine-protein phosphatase [Anaerolineales bacterium]
MLRRLLQFIPQQGLEYPPVTALVQPAVGDFHLQPHQRILPLERGFNFRGIGGYPAGEGLTVRPELIFRSAQLAHLSDADLAQIRALAPQLVIDLRSDQEVTTGPCQLAQEPDTRYLHRPISNGGNPLRQLHAVVLRRDRLPQVMYEGYTQVMIDGNAPVFGQVLKQLADPANHPAIVHCTAGKDRTGLVMAFLLLILGVPEAIVLADYSLSNLAYDQLVANLDGELRRVTELGIPLEQLQPIFAADPNLLAAALAYIRGQYGSLEAYLLGPAGLNAAVLTALRETLLA